MAARNPCDCIAITSIVWRIQRWLSKVASTAYQHHMPRLRRRLFMAHNGTLRIVAPLAVLLLTACASANLHPSPTATEPPTATAAALPLPALTPSVSSTPLTKTIYLTFDDGPNPSWTPEILSLLEESGAHASFFVIGESAKRWPGLEEREAQDGDTVGDHTWSHPTLTDLSASAVYVELGRDRNLITIPTADTLSPLRLPDELSN